LIAVTKPTNLAVGRPGAAKAEEDEFYRRIGRGLVTVARPASDRAKPTSAKQQQPSPAKPRSAELKEREQRKLDPRQQDLVRRVIPKRKGAEGDTGAA
jgi:hypothetical protein